VASFSNKAFDTDAFSTNAWDIGAVVLNTGDVAFAANANISDVVVGFSSLFKDVGVSVNVSDNVKAAANVQGTVAAAVAIND
jgi:hypothetical protein